MTSHIDDLTKRYFQPGGGTKEISAAVLRAALDSPITDSVVAGRAAELVIEASARFGLPDSLRPEIERLLSTIAATAESARAVDQLGEEGSSPAVLFDYLGESSDDLTMPIDRNSIDALRLNQKGRIAAGLRVLEAIGSSNAGVEQLNDLVAVGKALLARAALYSANALFEAGPGGVVLGVRVVCNDSGDIKAMAEVAHDLENQAEIALREALPTGRGARWNLEWSTVPSEGESIGLGLFVAAAVELGHLASDPLLACTGRLDIGGVVMPVGGISGKLHAAYRSGMRRVLLPQGNREEAMSVIAEGGLPLLPLFVVQARDARRALTSVSVGAQPSFEANVRFARSQIALEDVSITDEPREPFHRFVVENLSTKNTLDLYRTGTAVPGGPTGALLEALKTVKSRIEGPQPERRERLTLNIPPSHRAAVRDALAQLGAIEVPTTSEYEEWRFKFARGKSEVQLTQYFKGSLVIPPGTAPAFDQAIDAIRAACPGLSGLDDVVAKAAVSGGNGQATLGAVDEAQPHIGTDEAGKGDYFGPLVSAAVFVDADVVALLRSMGVKDSKQMSSDAAVRRLAAHIRELIPGRFDVTTIPPKAYNQLHAAFRAEGKNLNTLLAWGHMRSVEDLIKGGARPAFIVSDQFGDPRYIEQRLLAATKEAGVKVIQEPKAERYMAVAAASILARDGFLDWLAKAGDRLALTIPKGVSPAVITLARDLYARGGDALLDEYVKTSFKTTAQIKS